MAVLVLAAEHTQCETQETVAVELLHTFDDDDDDDGSEFLGTDENASTPAHAIATGMTSDFLAVSWIFRGFVDYRALPISLQGLRRQTQVVKVQKSMM